MKRFILPLLIIFIFISLPAKANDEVKTLLKVLDKSLQNKASYTQQKQRQIDSLKIILRQSRDIRKKVGTAQSLCFEYSSFQKDSALAYAIHMNRFAQESNDKELLIEAKLDYSRILSSMGFFKEALAITNSMQQKQLSPKLKAEYFLGDNQGGHLSTGEGSCAGSLGLSDAHPFPVPRATCQGPCGFPG